ncbi:GspE/PulE family protein [Aeromonas hydrophila]|jgi:general secretion pathway protein E|uniref:GspE/PulE family protein n=1 Tax=Aeromonas hydrophila TaxID=644 RepID=UPI00059E40E2|nr:GspE/PulE family protein [Aeromonas hydrophila]MBC8670030.1 Flp pilus assembly complex ATPase component TadA [Aeromonas hydrophila]MBC8687320.1 Flp pilus assembly complex ATPase component TadA [Aeromonas hydrophila]MBM0509899.1 type II secretion system protein [Aeromonas hydrophila]MBW3771792.1 type II secretion system protein [Aeromonas hydrophila]MCP3287049.1 GspE/PulE family protein [Aeromonas hydrophila]
MKIGEKLIAKGVIGHEDLERALEVQRQAGGRLGSILVRMGAVSEDAVLRSLSEQLGYLCIEPAYMPAPLDIYQCLLSLPVRLEWWLDNDALLWEVDGQLQLVAKDPLETQLQDLVAYLFTGRPVQYWLARTQDIDTLVDQVRRESAVTDLFSNSEHSLQALIEEAPVVELVNNLLAQAVDSGASDIHVEPEELRFTVRMRVDGVLHTHMVQPAERYPAIGSRIKLIAGLDIAEKRLPQDGRITLRLSGQDMDIRVSTAPGVHGESIVMRLLPKNRGTLSLEKLGFESDHLNLLHSWLACPNGIVLVTGPTGSGKSTTLYAALEAMRDGSNKIITVEDPVEYQVSGVTQIQAHNEIGYTFSRALRAILRQDPDTIMIGEIRDLDTAQIAIQSALTGHLVLSTLHTNDAASAFTRLVDMGLEPFLVAASVRGVQAQRLVRRLCEQCTVDDDHPLLPQGWSSSQPAFAAANWKKAVGCQHCHHTGYRGRLGIYELVALDGELQQLVNRQAPLQEIKSLIRQQGQRTLFEDGLIKASRGLTSIEEVMRVAYVEHD